MIVNDTAIMYALPHQLHPDDELSLECSTPVVCHLPSVLRIIEGQQLELVLTIMHDHQHTSLTTINRLVVATP